MSTEEARQAAESARLALAHYAIATSNAPWVVAGIDPYETSRAELLKTITAAYPDVPTARIYEVWVDCNETIAWCADTVRCWVTDEATQDNEGADEQLLIEDAGLFQVIDVARLADMIVDASYYGDAVPVKVWHLVPGQAPVSCVFMSRETGRSDPQTRYAQYGFYVLDVIHDGVPTVAVASHPYRVNLDV